MVPVYVSLFHSFLQLGGLKFDGDSFVVDYARKYVHNAYVVI